MRYRIGQEQRGGGTVYRLLDDSTGASASVLPAAGFNLFDLQLPVGEMMRPVLDAEADWANNPRSFGRNGTPILFPFPNRVRDGKFTFNGKPYQVPVSPGQHAIHGFAIGAPFDVVEHRACDDGATITGLYQISRQSPDRLTQWPADATLRVQYTLSGRRLTMDVTISNPTDRPLPVGFGIHPYFRMPFEKGGDQARTKVILPASNFWVLEGFLPTGEIRGVADEPRLDFRAGQPMSGLKLDDVLTGLEGSPRVCRLVDEALGSEFRLGFSADYRELVVYTPPGSGGVISLEPYTQTTDAINLQARGVDAGLQVLGHGESLALQVTMETVG